MSMSKRKLLERFLAGGDSGTASRLSLREIDGVRCVVGYNWAVYAADLGDGVALFGDGYKSNGDNVGWAGYSSNGQSTQHMQEIKGMLHEHGVPYVVVDAQLRCGKTLRGGPQIGDVDDLDAFVREHEVDPRDGTGYLP